MGCASWPHLPLRGAFDGGDTRRWSQRCSSTWVLAFVSNIEQIAKDSLSPEEFDQLTVADFETRRILDRSLPAAHDQLREALQKASVNDRGMMRIGWVGAQGLGE
jgi:hypothetical protein